MFRGTRVSYAASGDIGAVRGASRRRSVRKAIVITEIDHLM